MTQWQAINIEASSVQCSFSSCRILRCQFWEFLAKRYQCWLITLEFWKSSLLLLVLTWKFFILETVLWKEVLECILFSFGRNKLDSTLFLSLFCSVTLCMSLSSSGPRILLCGISGLNYPYWVVLSISLLLIGLLLFSWFKI